VLALHQHVFIMNTDLNEIEDYQQSTKQQSSSEANAPPNNDE
jgi:hypothetical protein